MSPLLMRAVSPRSSGHLSGGVRAVPKSESIYRYTNKRSIHLSESCITSSIKFHHTCLVVVSTVSPYSLGDTVLLFYLPLEYSLVDTCCWKLFQFSTSTEIIKQYEIISLLITHQSEPQVHGLALLLDTKTVAIFTVSFLKSSFCFMSHHLLSLLRRVLSQLFQVTKPLIVAWEWD